MKNLSFNWVTATPALSLHNFTPQSRPYYRGLSKFNNAIETTVGGAANA